MNTKNRIRDFRMTFLFSAGSLIAFLLATSFDLMEISGASAFSYGVMALLMTGCTAERALRDGRRCD